MIGNLSETTILIILGITGLIIIISIILLVLVIKTDDNKVEVEEPSIIKEPDNEPNISMSLASYDIPDIPQKKPANRKEELEIAAVQDQKNETTIEEMLKAITIDLEKQSVKTIDRYEEDQEENAVISYSELISKSSGSVDTTTKLKATYEETPKESIYSTRINTEVVSPVYGRVKQSSPKKTSIVEEYTEIMSNEFNTFMEETDEFLNTLKEFRKNL